MKANNKFIITQLVFLLITIPFLIVPKGTVELWVNNYHFTVLDYFFKIITYLGHGTTAVIIGIILLLFNYYRTIIFVSAIILNTAIIQGLMKNWLFKDIKRPKAFFNDDIVLNFVDGVSVHTQHSFPSGHTGLAFVIFLFLASIAPKRYYLPLFFIAIITAFSRVYLLQHFFMDIYVGSIVGSVSVIVTIFLFNRYSNLNNIQKWNRGLLFK